MRPDISPTEHALREFPTVLVVVVGRVTRDVGRNYKDMSSKNPPNRRVCAASCTKGHPRGPPFSVDRFRESSPERVRRIDAQDLHFLGVERKFLEREDQVALFGVALDIGVELGGEEIALDHVALELAHVDAVGGETA